MSIRILALNASCMRLKKCGMVVAITGINLRQIPEKCLQNRVASSSQALKEVQHSTSCLQQPVSIQNALRNNPRAREGRGQEQKQEAGAGCGEKARGRRRAAAAAHCGAACHMSHVTCHMSHVTCHMSHVTSSSFIHFLGSQCVAWLDLGGLDCCFECLALLLESERRPPSPMPLAVAWRSER